MDLKTLDLRALAGSLRSGTLTAVGLMRYCQERHQATEKHLNAYAFWDGTAALEMAARVDALLARGYDLGPLMGLPVSLKDMYAVPGMPTRAGSPIVLPAVWEVPGPLVAALMQQLALLVGKTHTVEFALGGVGINAHWGTPVNPRDDTQHRIPGGSSSGAGVSLLQGSAWLAMGTDTAGSVRIPAALTGTVGLKTTAGRWPRGQIVPLSQTLDSPGFLTRSVADAAFAFSALEARLPGRVTEHIADNLDCRGMRIGVPQDFFWDDAEPGVVARVEESMRRLESAGARLLPLSLPCCEPLFDMFCQGGLSVPELAAFLELELPDSLKNLDPVVRVRVEDGGAVSALEYLRRRELFRQASQQAASTFADMDLWLYPTVPITAPLVADLDSLEAYRRVNMLLLRNPGMTNLMGLCALSLPAGVDHQGLPVGVQLTAAAGREEQLLALGMAVERELDVQLLHQ